MSLPIPRTYAPMEALQVSELPAGKEWQYEPKWDGFRCLAFRDGTKVDLMSKSGKPLGRYFPDIVEALEALAPGKFVIDGEIVIPVGKLLSFDELLAAHPSGGEPGEDARGGASGDADRVRSPRRRRRGSRS